MSSEEKSRSEEDSNNSNSEENEDEEEESEHGTNSEEEDENILSNSSKNESGDLSDRSHSDNSKSFFSSENEKNILQSDEEIINPDINKDKFEEKKLLLSNEIKFEISNKDENKSLIKSDINKSDFIPPKELSRKSSNVKPDIFDKSLAFKILNEVSCNLDKLEKDLNENLKRMTILDKNVNSEKRLKIKKETINKLDDVTFPKDEHNSSEVREERIKITKRRNYSEKEVNTDFMGTLEPTDTGRLQNMDSSRYRNSRNDYNDNRNKESLRESGKFTNNFKETQKSKNYERNSNNNFANSHFRTIEDLYRNPYQNTQPIIYNRDNNPRNNKISQNSFYPVKYSNTTWNKKFSDVDSEDLKRPQDKYIKIEKNMNKTKNITHAMDILLEKKE